MFSSMVTTVKWIATAVIILGTAINGLGIWPEGAAILMMGGVLWFWVALKIHDWPLIVTNGVMVLVGTTAIMIGILQG